MNDAPSEDVRRHVVPPGGRTRLDRFLTAMEDEISRSQVTRLIQSGAVRVGDVLASKAGQTLVEGEVVTLTVPPPAPLRAIAEDIPLEIRFEDHHLIVVVKPAGLVVHPAQGHPTGTLVNALLHHCHDLAGIGGVLRPGIVHRLDADTTGLLVVAKSDEAHRGLVEQFQRREVYRRYLALIHGGARLPDSGRFETLYGRHPRDRKRFSSQVTKGKEALTNWRVILRGDPLGLPVHLVEARLETGRTHQIRVHFADAGHPLVGDSVYGGRRRAPTPLDRFPRQALHAYALGFEHPVTGERLTFREPPPADLADALRAVWGDDAAEALARLLEPIDRPFAGEGTQRVGS